MTTEKQFRTEQEDFWAGAFGADYIQRNRGTPCSHPIWIFRQSTSRHARRPVLHRIRGQHRYEPAGDSLLYPGIEAFGIEINPVAAQQLAELIAPENVFCGSILDFQSVQTRDLALIKGVLIHVNPMRSPMSTPNSWRRPTGICSWPSTTIHPPWRFHIAATATGFSSVTLRGRSWIGMRKCSCLTTDLPIGVTRISLRTTSPGS